MSRIIVKNLPTVVCEEDLKKHFADIDNITDVKLKQLRRFAFIGFKSSDAAEKAVQNLNNTFVKNSKIILELCQQIKDIKPEKLSIKHSSSIAGETTLLPNHTRPQKGAPKNEKDRLDKSVKAKKSQDDIIDEELARDPQFKEFLSLQRNIEQNIKTKHVWADDVEFDGNTMAATNTSNNNNDKIQHVLADDGGRPKKKKHKRSRGKKKLTDRSKPKEIFVHTIKVRGFPPEAKRKDVKDFFKPLDVISIRLCKRDEVCYVSFKNDADLKFSLRKNHHFFGTHRIKILKHNATRSRAFQETMVEKAKIVEDQFKKYEASLADVEPIEESGRLFIRNLNYTCVQEDIEQMFSKYGEITEIHFPIDKKTSLPKGYAFVEFLFPANAKTAYEELNGTIFQGRNFHLIPSKPRPSLTPSQQAIRHTNPEAKSAFKREKIVEQKKDGSKGSNWNILFLGQNAVADLGADSKQMDKSKFLTEQSRKEPIAVRMALADAAIVDETRKFLVSNGIELDCFDNPQTARSRNVILAKNLSSTVTKTDLMDLFGANNAQVSRVLLPPRGLTAIVEMDDATDAKNAFKRLAYSKYKDCILYLEWAPINIFRQNNVEDQDRRELEELAKRQTGTKIVVKNVPFEATPQELRKIFAAFGELNFLRFVKKIDGQHRGFAFVDFLTRENALRAFNGLCHSTHLYGRKLVLEWAKASEGDEQQVQQSNQTSLSSAPMTRMLPQVKRKREDHDDCHDDGV